MLFFADSVQFIQQNLYSRMKIPVYEGMALTRLAS